MTDITYDKASEKVFVSCSDSPLQACDVVPMTLPPQLANCAPVTGPMNPCPMMTTSMTISNGAGTIAACNMGNVPRGSRFYNATHVNFSDIPEGASPCNGGLSPIKDMMTDGPDGLYLVVACGTNYAQRCYSGVGGPVNIMACMEDTSGLSCPSGIRGVNWDGATGGLASCGTGGIKRFNISAGFTAPDLDAPAITSPCASSTNGIVVIPW